jgi:hypothetical protein
MNLLSIILGCTTIVFAVVTFFLYRTCALMAAENSSLKTVIRIKEIQISALRQAEYARPVNPPAISDKVRKLITLAVSKNNEHEANVAAREVCKRLSSGRY